jgi:hypothetical protein
MNTKKPSGRTQDNAVSEHEKERYELEMLEFEQTDARAPHRMCRGKQPERLAGISRLFPGHRHTLKIPFFVAVIFEVFARMQCLRGSNRNTTTTYIQFYSLFRFFFLFHIRVQGSWLPPRAELWIGI